MDFTIKKEYKLVEEMTEEELENCPTSAGFWYSLEEGDGEMFIDLLEDKETQEECRKAIQTLSKLERAIDDYIDWM